MKKAIRISGIIATAAACATTGLLFTGCGEDATAGVTTETLFNATQEKLKNTSVVNSDFDMNIDIEAKVSGIATDMKLTGDYTLNSDYNNSVFYLDGGITTEVIGISATQNTQSYLEKTDKKITTYKRSKSSSDLTGDETADWSAWTFNSMELAEGFNGFTGVDNLYNVVDTVVENLTLQKDTANVNGYECYVVKGKITGQKLKEMLKDTNVELGEFDIELTFYFDKSTNVIYRLEVDLGEGMRKAMEKTLSDSGLIGTDTEITFKESKLTITHNEFSNDKKLTIPEDVKKNAKEDTEATSLFGLFGQ